MHTQMPETPNIDKEALLTKGVFPWRHTAFIEYRMSSSKRRPSYTYTSKFLVGSNTKPLAQGASSGLFES